MAQFAVTCSRTTPFGRWEASTRCTPSDRPRAATSATTAPSSGKRSIIAWNSSMTSTRRGRSTCGASSEISRTRSARRTASRWRSSARRLSTARSASPSSRSVTMPVTCGRPRTGSNAAPPLKSTRRNDTRSGGWPSASAAIHASRNSLLPLPVVPATIACGPRVARSSTSGPPATAPTAARSVSLEPGRRVGCASASYGTASGRAAVGATPSRSPAVASRARQRSRLGEARQRRHDRATPVPVAAPPHDRAHRRRDHHDGLEPDREPVDGLRDGDHDRVVRRGSRVRRRWPRVASSSRTTDGPRRCGSPVAQAHSGPRGTAMATTPGRHRCATCTSSARAADLASADGPTTPIPPSAGASTGAPSRRAASLEQLAVVGIDRRAVDPHDAPRRAAAEHELTRDRRRASRADAGRRGSGAPARPAATPPCARARASRRSTHAARRAARRARPPPSAASVAPAAAHRGPRRRRRPGRGRRRRRESAEPVIAQSTTAPPTGAIAAIHGKPGVGGSGGCDGRVSGTPGGSAKSADVGEVGDVGLVSFHPGIRSSAADADSTDRRVRRDRRPPGRLCRTSGATPATAAVGATARNSSGAPRQATVNDCSASSTRLPRGTR